MIGNKDSEWISQIQCGINGKIIADIAELSLVRSWLLATLECESFSWDHDQYDAAMESVKYLSFILENQNDQ